MLRHDWHPLVQVVDCDAPSEDGSGFGVVKYGHLMLKGRLQPVKWIKIQTRPRPIRGRGLAPQNLWVPVIGDTRFSPLDIRWDDGRPQDAEIDESLRDSTFMTSLGWAENVGPERNDMAIALFLHKRYQPPSQHWYERVGLLRVRREKHHRDLYTISRGRFCSFVLNSTSLWSAFGLCLLHSLFRPTCNRGSTSGVSFHGWHDAGTYPARSDRHSRYNDGCDD